MHAFRGVGLRLRGNCVVILLYYCADTSLTCVKINDDDDDDDDDDNVNGSEFMTYGTE